MDSVWRYGCGVALVMECRLSALFPTKWSPVGGLNKAPVVESQPARPVAGPMTEADVAWLDARRVGHMTGMSDESGALVSKLPDEGAL